MKKLKFGIIGIGFGGDHLRFALLLNPKAELIAISDIDKDFLRRRAEQWDIDDYYDNYYDLLENKDLDAVAICTPHNTHAEIAIAACKAGKHVLLEKPMCQSVKEGEEIIKAAKEAGIKLMVGESYVFTTSHMEARRLIESGEIGDLICIKHYKGPWLPRTRTPLEKMTEIGGIFPDRPNYFYEWMEDPAQCGGGEYLFLGSWSSHLFATAKYLFKDREIKKIFAIPSAFKQSGMSGQKASLILSDKNSMRNKITTKDIPIIFWEYKDKKHGVLIKRDEIYGQLFGYTGLRTTISGTDGTIEVFGEGGGHTSFKLPPLVLHKKNKTICIQINEGLDRVWNSVVNYYDQAFVNEINHFIDCILKDKDVFYSGQEGLMSVKCILATIKSAMEGEFITLDSIPRDWLPGKKLD